MSYGMFHAVGRFSQRLANWKALKLKALGLALESNQNNRLRRFRRLQSIDAAYSKVWAEEYQK